MADLKLPKPAPDREIAAAMFSGFAEHVRQHGAPFPGGEWLRESMHVGQVVCEQCGMLSNNEPTAEWLTLCGDAKDHVKETGHWVAVHASQEAIYGPKETTGD